jgi:hypothetical protein
MVAAAAIGGAVVGGVATAYSGKKAAGAAESGAEQSAAVQQYMFDTSRKDLAPWLRTGQSALQKLSALNGVPYNTTPSGGAADYSADNFDRMAYLRDNPDVAAAKVDPWEHWVNHGQYENRIFPAFNKPVEGEYIANGEPDYSDFYNSPDYKFTFSEGQRAVNAGLAARGLSNSGRAMKELTRYGQGAASTQLNNYRNALAAMAGVGQTTGTNLASLGSQTGANIGQTYQNAADARASGYISRGNAVSGGINNAFGTYALMNLMNQQAA